MNNPSSLHTLRISLTGESGISCDLISFEQIRLAAKAAVDHGIKRFILSGGEPLEREDLPLLLMMLSSLTVLEDMQLTTDGILLPRWAKSIRGAGVRRVTVRLDTFDPAKYRKITEGGDMTAVLAGIRAMMEVGFPPATLEVRLIRGVNDDEIPSLVRLTRMTGVSLRFMELTPEEAEAFSPNAHMHCSEVLRLAPELTQDVASRLYHLPGAAGMVTLVPVGERETGCLCLSADGTLRADGMSVCIAGMDEHRIAEAVSRFFE